MHDESHEETETAELRWPTGKRGRAWLDREITRGSRRGPRNYRVEKENGKPRIPIPAPGFEKDTIKKNKTKIKRHQGSGEIFTGRYLTAEKKEERKKRSNSGPTIKFRAGSEENEKRDASAISK